jgi:hypothetical protein
VNDPELSSGNGASPDERDSVRCDAWLGVVVPGGWLDGLLRRVSNPRKWRWNAYLRACKRIPAGSPVAGTTAWKKINSRRHDLIVKKHGGGGLLADEEKEFRSLQNVCGVFMCGGMVCQNLVMSRSLRRLRAAFGAEGTTTPSAELSDRP